MTKINLTPLERLERAINQRSERVEKRGTPYGRLKAQRRLNNMMALYQKLRTAQERIANEKCNATEKGSEGHARGD
jgi:hypothetical protein